MKRQLTVSTLKWCLFLGLALSSKGAFADGLSHTINLSAGMDVRFEFSTPEPAGIETDRLQNRLWTIKVRGWHVARTAWFGQTRIAHRTGFGLVVQNGNTVYQLNNRGFQITKYF